VTSASPRGGPLPGPPPPAAEDLALVLREQRRRLVARLARSLGLAHLAVAEDAVQTAALRALGRWPVDGVPDNPAGWLYRVAQRAAIDALRHEAPEVAIDDEAIEPLLPARAAQGERFRGELDDDELALLFAACHPALPEASQVALALRAVRGFELSVIADGLLTNETALAQRLARARALLRDQPLELPAGPELPPRRDAVLHALHLMFNAGWQAGAGASREICWDAIRLARALAAHPAAAHPDADALAALLLLHGARLTGRHDAAGEIVPLPGQPRDRWDQGMLRLALAHLDRARKAAALSRWHLLAGIAAAHALAPDYARTPWDRIVGFYDALLAIDDSAAPRLSHAIALAEAGQAQRARRALESLLPQVPDALRAHAHAALSHALWLDDDRLAARRELDAAIACVRNEADRRLLERRRAALQA
jgi:RNA polymerase sigma-70 factor, ECF subfamily